MTDRPDLRDQRNIPRSHTVEPMDPPSLGKNSTTAQLKADIDSGRTGDKVAFFDPGLSPLGTDDEAAGTPPEPERVDLARHQESTQRWADGEKDSYAHQNSRKALFGFVGFIGLLLVLFIGAFSLF